MATALLDLALPRVCVACDEQISGGGAALVCGLCWTRLPMLPPPICERCGHPVSEGDCAWCSHLPPYVRAARSCCWYPAPVGEPIIRALKYQGWSRVAQDVGERMARLVLPEDVVSESPVIVPVPLSSTRLRERGYNQSELLARELGVRWGFPVLIDSLQRNRSSGSQTRLTPEERARNVRGAFSIAPASSGHLRGAHVVLVDDVITTGSTMNECAAALLAGGARLFTYVTFGRARAAGDIG